MITGKSNGYTAYEKMYHYAVSSHMYIVQPSRFVYGMETFLLFWILMWMISPSMKRWLLRLKIKNKNK